MRRVLSIIGSFVPVTFCIFALSGCGAGTGSSLNSPSLSSRAAGNGDGAATSGGKNAGSVLPSKRFGLFVTDYVAEKTRTAGVTEKPATLPKVEDATPATDYAHVYVTVHKIELLTADEQAFPIWADDNGRTVDLAALRDGVGERVALLGGVPAPGATGKKAYKRARITLGKSITFLKRGESSAKATPLADSIGRDDEGLPVLTVNLDRPRDLGTGKEDLVLAFDRSGFTFADGRVTPAIREARAGVKTDADRQEATTFTGTVAESTAGGDGPERVFALLPDGGARGENLLVWLRSSAVFYRADGKPSPALTDGARVQVRGTMHPGTKRIVAASVAVLPEEEKSGDTARVLGSIADATADSGTLTLETLDTDNVAPVRTGVTATLAPDAVLRSVGGLVVTKEQFFAAAKQPGARVEAEGDYEPTTGILTARRAVVVGKTDETAPREAEIFAVARTVNEGGKSLTVAAPLAEWDGIVPPADGKTWTVNAGVGTTCVDAEGKQITLADLLLAAKDEKNAVRAVGTYAGGAITATRLELKPAPAKVEKPVAKAEKTGKGKPEAAVIGRKPRPDTEPDTEKTESKEDAKRETKPAPDPAESPATP